MMTLIIAMRVLKEIRDTWGKIRNKKKAAANKRLCIKDIKVIKDMDMTKDAPLLKTAHPLIKAAYDASRLGCAMRLGPDIFYCVILHSVSQHLHMHPSQFSDAIGEITFPVQLSYASLKQCRKSDFWVREGHRLMSTSFSTTQATDADAHTAAIMDIFGVSQVDYHFETEDVFTREDDDDKSHERHEDDEETAIIHIRRRDMPHYDVLGNGRDWRRLKNTVRHVLAALNLSAWNAELEKIFNEIILVVEGTFGDEFWDVSFWNNVSRFDVVSNGQLRVTGWICRFFLYSVNGSDDAGDNSRLDPLYHHPNAITGVHSRNSMFADDFPSGWLSTPVSVGSDKHSHRIHSGIFGIKTEESGTLAPFIGCFIEGPAK